MEGESWWRGSPGGGGVLVVGESWWRGSPGGGGKTPQSYGLHATASDIPAEKPDVVLVHLSSIDCVILGRGCE